MSSEPGTAPEPATARSMQYPFATSPDVLRTHQKDAYITSELTNQASTILRALLGVRFAHKYSAATSHLTELLYLCLTTLPGNRTLGEEYCDVIQVDSSSPTLRLAGLPQRASYIVSVIFTPWFLSLTLPRLRQRLRSKLEHNIARLQHRLKIYHRETEVPRSLRIQQYFLSHLDTLTSLSPIYALSLATFYFTGSYYHISKRLTSLRYIFTKQIVPQEQREGYEVLGILLVLQLGVQLLLHIREKFFTSDTADPGFVEQAGLPTSAMVGPGIEIPISSSQPTVAASPPTTLPAGLSANTSTPILPAETYRYHLAEPNVMAWIDSDQQRKCTLCLEPFKDPSVTTCGHVFCWECVMDWVKEKAECPLCRQAVMNSKILPLRGGGEG